MPTYEYECLACKHRFERFQKFSEPPVAECPECGSAVRKVLFPAGIVFKGSGWYVTDSRPSSSSENGSSGASSTGDAGAAGAAGEKKSEPAAASKNDAKTDASGSTGSAKTTDSPKTSTPSTPSSSTPAKA